ncbi:50S ribosomal protein L10 [bacterium]|nr:50S ribosomal protein L10 [bacterium]
MDKKQKAVIINELKDNFSKSQGICLTDFKKLTVQNTNELRKRFKEQGIVYRVYKNTFAKQVCNENGVKNSGNVFSGETGFAFSFDDPSLPAKIVAKFSKENQDIPAIKACIIDKRIYEKDQISVILSLPTREELIAKMLGSLNAPITNTVSVLNGLLRNLVGVVNAIKEKKENN